MYLIIDTRERAVIPFLDTEIKKFKYIQKQINTGDYLICSQFDSNLKIHACIERKTYVDFAASFRDGRYTAGIEKMKKLRSETGCQLYFFIEGTAFPSITRKFSRIPYTCILGAINKLMVKHNIFIIQTEYEQHTAKRLNDLLITYEIVNNEIVNIKIVNNEIVNNEIVNNEIVSNEIVSNEIVNNEIVSNKIVNIEIVNIEIVNNEIVNNEIVNNDDSIKKLTLRIPKTTEEIILKSWSTLTGISIVLSKLLSDKYTISDIATKKISIDEIKSFKSATGKIINKDAISSILSIRTGNIILEAKLLSAVPGITISTATFILKNIGGLSSLCSYTLPYLKIILIPRGTATMKLGEKKALLLYTLLH